MDRVSKGMLIVDVTYALHLRYNAVIGATLSQHWAMKKIIIHKSNLSLTKSNVCVCVCVCVCVSVCVCTLSLSQVGLCIQKHPGGSRPSVQQDVVLVQHQAAQGEPEGLQGSLEGQAPDPGKAQCGHGQTGPGTPHLGLLWALVVVVCCCYI